MVLALEANDAFREQLGNRYKYILVDEYQDTNHAQLRLVNALAQKHRNLCVVGDDDQSIYGWRGADRRNILDFAEKYADAEVIKLEQNYRSTKRIIRAAHQVIARNQDRQPKELWTDNDEGEPIIVAEVASGRAEADLIADAITELHSQGNKLKNIAVFYRIHAQSRLLEESLRARNIPYRVIGGTRFYDRAEVKDALAYLRVLANPQDDINVLRIINTPARGIGKVSIERLLNFASEKGISLRAALLCVDECQSLGEAAKKKLKAFAKMLAGFEAKLGRSGESENAALRFSELMALILEETGYIATLAAQDTPEAEARLQNLQELIGSMVTFEEQDPMATLEGFLESVTLYTSADESAFEDSLLMMTVHAAKGLEFDHVFVAGMEDKLFPFRGLDPWDDPDELEEERRLAYVAITRAKKRLVCTYARARRIFNEFRPGYPSMFLADIPKNDIETIGVEADYGDDAEHYEPAYEAEYYPNQKRTARASKPARQNDASPDTGPGYQESIVDRSDSDFQELVLGMYVRHARFGIGKVAQVTGGSPPRVIVRFPEYGEKKLVASFLEPA